MKKCLNCFHLKPLEDFYRKLDGRQSRCKACNAEFVRGYNQRAKRKRIAERWKYMLHADAAIKKASA